MPDKSLGSSSKLSELLEKLQMEQPDNELVKNIAAEYETMYGEDSEMDLGMGDDEDLGLEDTEEDTEESTDFESLLDEDMSDEEDMDLGLPPKKMKKKKKSPADFEMGTAPEHIMGTN